MSVRSPSRKAEGLSDLTLTKQLLSEQGVVVSDTPSADGDLLVLPIENGNTFNECAARLEKDLDGGRLFVSPRLDAAHEVRGQFHSKDIFLGPTAIAEPLRGVLDHEVAHAEDNLLEHRGYPVLTQGDIYAKDDSGKPGRGVSLSELHGYVVSFAAEARFVAQSAEKNCSGTAAQQEEFDFALKAFAGATITAHQELSFLNERMRELREDVTPETLRGRLKIGADPETGLETELPLAYRMLAEVDTPRVWARIPISYEGAAEDYFEVMTRTKKGNTEAVQRLIGAYLAQTETRAAVTDRISLVFLRAAAVLTAFSRSRQGDPTEALQELATEAESLKAELDAELESFRESYGLDLI
jgi:hypothetical protein